MYEEHELISYKMQKKNKPKIADIITAFFDDDDTISAIQNFNSWLLANKLTVAWASRNVWDIKCKGKRVCRIVVKKGAVSSWCIDFETAMLEDAVLGEKEKTVIWKNIQYCVNCSSCMPGRIFNIFNKKFEGCCIRPIAFNAPNVEEIEIAKQLIEIISTFIRSGREIAKDPTSPNPAHVAQQQKTAKIEDYFSEQLENKIKNASLDFFMDLKKNKIVPKFKMLNWWEGNYKGLICKIRLPYHQQTTMFSWAVGIYLDHIKAYENEIMNNELQNIILDNLIPCRNCPFTCALGVDVNIFDKKIKGVCIKCSPKITWIFDPDKATLTGIVKLLELEQQVRKKKPV